MPSSRLESIYYKLPVKIQNLIFSLYGLKLKSIRYDKNFKNYLEQYKRTEWSDSDTIKTKQNESFLKLLKHAYETVPFYKRWYDENDVDIKNIKSIDDIDKLPILTKKLVYDNQNDLISNIYNKKSLISNLTSGTSGTPIKVLQTKDSISKQWAIFWRHKARFGLTIDDKQLMIGARLPISQEVNKPPYWRNDFFNNRVYLSAYHISENTVQRIVNFLNKNHFDFFNGYPSALYNLAVLMEEKNLKLYNRPKYIVTSSDALTDKRDHLIKKVFGAPTTEFYGNVEFAGTMSKCKKSRFHVDYEHCYIEKHKIRHSNYYNLILTSWGNYAMPFIRYDIGDYGIPSETKCECGRESESYISIEGRVEDFIITPDGRKIIGMNQVFEYATNAIEIQLYQEEKNSVLFKIVPNENFNENDKISLLREFRRRAGNSIKVNFKFVDKIEKSETGKFKAVISNFD